MSLSEGGYFRQYLVIRRLVCSSISSVPDAIGLRMNFCAPASKNLLDSSMMSSLLPTAISSLGSF